VYLTACHVRLTKKTFYLHLMFHGTLLIVFGLLHQGGLSPLIRQLYATVHSDSSSLPTEILFYRTYMPPTHLLMVPKAGLLDSSSSGPYVHVVDLAGRLSEQELASLLEQKLRTNQTTRLIVVAPGHVNHSCNEQLVWQELASTWPHLSLDHLEAFSSLSSLADSLYLKAYRVAL
jgi:phosphatidylinositol glycan class Z